MGNIAFRVLAGLGVAAIFEEPSTSGEELDHTAGRNAPVASPESYLDKIRFSTALDILEVVSDTTVTISHGSVTGGAASGVSASGGGVSGGADADGTGVRFGASSVEFDLVTHSLGYEPDFLIVVSGQVLFPGRPVQTNSDGRGRYCAAYATTTKIRLHEWTSVSATTLAAQSIDYRVLVFRNPRNASGSDLFKFDETTGILKMGYDRFSSDRNYLQVVSGGSPFGIAYGKTIDLANGAPRFVNPDGSYFEPVPSTQKARLIIRPPRVTYTGAYGNAMNYNGSYAGPEQILVQAP